MASADAVRREAVGPVAAEHHESGALRRVLTGVTNGALTFAAVGVFGGLMSLYGFSLANAGGSMFWSWPIVGISVGAMVLVWAELASTYPFAGSMYQWPTLLAGKRVGWGIGWLYLGGLIPLMTAYAASEPVVVRPLFNWTDNVHTDLAIILVTLAFAVAWNLGAVKFLGRLSQLSIALELGVCFVVLIIVFLIGPHHLGNLSEASTVVTNGSKSTVQGVGSFGDWLPLFLAGGIFMAFWVQYTFENGGTLGEETIHAEKNAPKGVIGAFIFTIVCGFVFLVALTPSLTDLHGSMISGTPAQDAIGVHMPDWVTHLFLFAIAQGLLMATAAMFACAVRHIYGMARDGQVPFSGFFSRTLPWGSPWTATIGLGVLAAIPVLIFTTNIASVVGGATAAMYLPYFLVMLIALVARFRGWPHQRRWFSLGKWGIPVNVVAVLGTGLTLFDLMWKRPTTNPTYEDITGNPGGFFSHIPMGWYIVLVPLILGAVYYAFRSRRIHEHELAIESKLPHIDRTVLQHGGYIRSPHRYIDVEPAVPEVSVDEFELKPTQENP